MSSEGYATPFQKVMGAIILIAVVLAICGLISIIAHVTQKAAAQSIHPDVMWVYRLVDSLEQRVKRLEEKLER